ncbi:hypothetical protein Zm00014a_043991 [Zea mays]|uniref:Uncharacterized protein n=1 Tax=Zea mays TaxID=4577 RepID=A0A3L6F6J7_MAIZE|nr:hypothetical protein Zm00014a_043991 [Zea mays]
MMHISRALLKKNYT